MGTDTQIQAGAMNSLHIRISQIILTQMHNLPACDGQVFNVGGGRERSVSLLELTGMCQERSGRQIEIAGDPQTNPADVPYYVTDNTQIATASSWVPRRNMETLLDDIFSWLRREQAYLEPILNGPTTPVAALPITS